MGASHFYLFCRYAQKSEDDEYFDSCISHSSEPEDKYIDDDWSVSKDDNDAESFENHQYSPNDD